MPIWLNALGVASIGIVYGYILLYALKRCLPPVSKRSPSLKELVLLMTSLGIGGIIGVSVTGLEGVNYIGPYGLGLLFGVAANVVLTISIELMVWRLGVSFGEQETSVTNKEGS